MILVCYDGSIDAQSAIERAGKLMPGAEATVLSVWEPYIDEISRGGVIGLGFGAAGGSGGVQELDEASEQATLDIARDGAERATAAGLVAHARIATRHGGVAFAILDVAAGLDVDVVVMGTRGRGTFKSHLLGSVSHEVSEHADRAVLIVPSAGRAEHRRGWIRHGDDESDGAGR